jgi:hypothetical protein
VVKLFGATAHAFGLLRRGVHDLLARARHRAQHSAHNVRFVRGCWLRFARRPSQLPDDDSSDDNRDDSGPLNYVPYSPKMGRNPY